MIMQVKKPKRVSYNQPSVRKSQHIMYPSTIYFTLLERYSEEKKFKVANFIYDQY